MSAIPARSATALLALALAGLSGCLDPGTAPGDVTVATTWPASDRARLDASFRKAARAPVTGRIRWVVLEPGDDPTRLVRLRRPPDVILGGPASAYPALAASGLVERETNGAAVWRQTRRRPVGLVFPPGREPTAASARDWRTRSVFDDPRSDPAALSALGSELAAGPWAEAYARLVRWAGGPIRPGWRPGTAAAAVRRGTAGSTAAVGPGPLPGFVAEAGWPDWVEGVGLLRRAPHRAAGRAFVDHLAELGLATPADPNDVRRPAAELLADLLGATLIDAREELLAAWEALERAGHPERAERWMTTPPPWPPASVARVLDRMPLVETLAGQLAPDAEVRDWLLRSWIAPGRVVDGALLDELAGAADGRLLAEPRFRAWLRSEWTAWARQRYRRVARTAGGRWSPPADPGAPAVPDGGPE